MNGRDDGLVWTDLPKTEAAIARCNEWSSRSAGLFELAVQWQQFADAIEAHSECYPCQYIKRSRLGDAP